MANWSRERTYIYTYTHIYSTGGSHTFSSRTSVRSYGIASITTSNRLKSQLVGQLVPLCVLRNAHNVAQGCGYIYEGVPFVYIPGGNKGFRQGWMVRGGSSLHCSLWNPNVIHKGASHYLTCICLTHTGPVQPVCCTHTQANRRDRLPPHGCATRRYTRFHGVWNRIYMAADCAAIRALISHETVKSPWERNLCV